MTERGPDILEIEIEGTEVSLGFKRIVVITIIIACSAFLVFPYVNNTNSSDLYSVVFDAGSTGSRMFVFHFKLRQTGTMKVLGVSLMKEVFEATEPGISSYALKPSEVVESLQPLLNKAVYNVPESQRPVTQITFMATAGLRLLSQEKGEAILTEVRHLISGSPFYLPQPKKIRIMGGEEEGLFGWITVNYLLDLLWDEDTDNTVASIDLGGGSVQVSFESSEKTNAMYLRDDLFHVKLLQSEFIIFTKSYLGNGLKSSRLGIMGREEGLTAPSSKLEDKAGNEYLVWSPCFPSGNNLLWTHADVTYRIRGTTESFSSLEACRESVHSFVQRSNFVKHPELSGREIYLFSYFFDVAQWAKLITKNADFRVLTPDHFYASAVKYCESDNVSEEYPFLCMDLLYIHSMLTLGFGLPADKRLHVGKKIIGHEISWSLGAALTTLSNDFSYSSLRL